MRKTSFFKIFFPCLYNLTFQVPIGSGFGSATLRVTWIPGLEAQAKQLFPLIVTEQHHYFNENKISFFGEFFLRSILHPKNFYGGGCNFELFKFIGGG